MASTELAAGSAIGEGGGGSSSGGGGNAIVVARYSYKAVDDTELTVKKSERLMLLDDSQHWWRVQNASGQEGYVPSNYMKRARQGLFSSLKSSLSKKKKKQQLQQRGADDGLGGGARERSQSAAAGATTGGDRLASSGPPDSLSPGPVSGFDQAAMHHHQGQTAAAALPAGAALATSLPQRTAIARYAYAATQEDELSLEKGDRIVVVEESSDGWWRGRHLAGGANGAGGTERRRSGWFPSNYVVVELADNNGENHVAAGGGGSGFAEPAPSAAASDQKPQQQPSLFRVLALYRFTASHSEEMEFAENETLSVLAMPADDPEWWLARNSAGRQGLVPRNYVRPLPSDPSAAAAAAPASAASTSAPAPAAPASATANPRLAFVAGDHHLGLTDRPFYWGRIGRSEADRMLMQMASPGEFIVRAGESNPEDLTLTMRAKTKNRNFKIRQVEEVNGLRYNIGQKYFTDLEDLIRHYKEHPIYRSDDERCFLVAPFQHPSFAGTKL